LAQLGGEAGLELTLVGISHGIRPSLRAPSAVKVDTQ